MRETKEGSTAANRKREEISFIAKWLGNKFSMFLSKFHYECFYH
jgi:phage antirepressor YoqD-like protein